MLLRIIGCCVIAVAIASLAYHIDTEQKASQARIADRNTRCAEQLKTPPKPFQSDLSCIGWRPPSDIPLPAEG